MYIKNHTHCSVESVSERRTSPFHCRQSVNRSEGCRSPRHRTRLPRASEDRGTPIRDGLKTFCSETSTKNASPSRPPHHQCADPGADFPEESPSTNELRGPRRRFVPGTNKRPRVCVVKNKHLKPSCHRAGNNDPAFPTPNATRRVPTRCVRTTRSPVPVRGPTSPSTPHVEGIRRR
jgi:hypothetical protein